MWEEQLGWVGMEEPGDWHVQPVTSPAPPAVQGAAEARGEYGVFTARSRRAALLAPGLLATRPVAEA